MIKTVQPQTLKGFNDWFAEDVKLRKFVIQTFESVFEKYGYEPLETPAVEYAEFMTGVSGEEAEKQFYRFKDPGDRDVMLKYEVMTGMCRAVASNLDKITFPYKRYQIQPVWRAENTQKGRYRQFTQADADTVGSPSMIADTEFIQMGLEITEKLGFKEFIARISNRKFLDGLRELLEIPENKFYGMCMAIDKLKKIGLNEVKKELVEVRGLSVDQAIKVMEIIDTNQYKKLSSSEIVTKLLDTVGQTKIGLEGLSELKEIFDYLDKSGVPNNLYCFDTSLARGLASYTGPIWEFEIIDGGVGSIAGCGRYNNVIGRYLGGNRIVPATGGSFGIERICDIIKDRQMLNLGKTNTKVLVTVFSSDLLPDSLIIANNLRQKGINTDLYAVPGDKLDKQFKYADQKGIPFAIILGPDEKEKGTVTIKDLESRTQKTVLLEELIKEIS